MFIVQINAEKERLKNIFEQEKMALQKQQDREIEELKRKHAQRKETVQEQLQELVLAFVCDSLFCQIRSHCADHNILSWIGSATYFMLAKWHLFSGYVRFLLDFMLLYSIYMLVKSRISVCGLS